MNQKLLRKISLVFLVSGIIGLSGSILFFPVNFGNRYSCLFHLLMLPDQASTPEMPATPTGPNDPQAETMRQYLQQQYFRSYRYYWWGSLLLLALSLAALKASKKTASPTDEPQPPDINFANQKFTTNMELTEENEE